MSITPLPIAPNTTPGSGNSTSATASAILASTCDGDGVCGGVVNDGAGTGVGIGLGVGSGSGVGGIGVVALSRLGVRLSGLESELGAIKAEKEALTAQLERWRKSHATLESELSESRAAARCRVSELQDELATITQRAMAAEDAAAELRRQLDGRRSTLEGLLTGRDHRVAELQASLASVREEVGNKEAERAAAAGQLKGMGALVEALEAEQAALRQQLLDLGTRHQTQEAGLAACRSWVQEQLGEGTATASGLREGGGANGDRGGGHGGGLVFLAGELKRCLHGTQAVAERLRSSEASCTALRLQSSELAAQLHSAQSLAASLRLQLATRDEELAFSLAERGRLAEAVAGGEDLVESAEAGLCQLKEALHRLQERFTGSFMAAMERAAEAAADVAAARRRCEELEAAVKSAAAADAATAARQLKVSTADAWTSTADRMQFLTASAVEIAGGSLAVSHPSAPPTVAQQQLPSGAVLPTPLTSILSTAMPVTAATATIPCVTNMSVGLQSNGAQEPILMTASPLRPSLPVAAPLNAASGNMKSLGRTVVALATADVDAAAASFAGAQKQTVVTSAGPVKPQLEHNSNQERIALTRPASREQAGSKSPDAHGVVITIIEAAATAVPPTLAPHANSDASGRLGVLHARASPRGVNEVSAAAMAAAVISLKPAAVTSIPSPSAVESGANGACAARAAVEPSGVDPMDVDVGVKECGQAAHKGLELVQQAKKEHQPRSVPQPLGCDRGWEHLSKQQQEPRQQQQPELLQRQQRFQSPDSRQQHRQGTENQSALRAQPPCHLAPRSAADRSSSTSPPQDLLRTTLPSHQSIFSRCNDEHARSAADCDVFLATAAEGVVTPLAPLKAGSVEVMHDILLPQQQKQAQSHTVQSGAVELQQQKAALGEHMSPWLAGQDLHGGLKTPKVDGDAEAAAVACEALASPVVAVPEASVKVPDLTAVAADVAVRESCEIQSDTGVGGDNASCCTYLELNKGLLPGRLALLQQLVLHQSPSAGEDEPTMGMGTQGFHEEIAAMAAPAANTVTSFDCIGQEPTRRLQPSRTELRQLQSPVETSRSVKGRGEASGTCNDSAGGIIACDPYIPVPDCGPRPAHSGLRIGAVDVPDRVVMTSPDVGRGERSISCLGKTLDDEDTCKGATDGASRSFAGMAASIYTGDCDFGSDHLQDNACGVIIGGSGANASLAGAAAAGAVNGLAGQSEFGGVNMPYEARVEPWVGRKRPRSALAGLFSAFALVENSQEGEHSQGREAGGEWTEGDKDEDEDGNGLFGFMA